MSVQWLEVETSGNEEEEERESWRLVGCGWLGGGSMHARRVGTKASGSATSVTYGCMSHRIPYFTVYPPAPIRILREPHTLPVGLVFYSTG